MRSAKIIERHRFTVDRALGGAGIRAQIKNTVAKILRGTKLAAIGVGYGGPVDWRTGKICVSHHIEGWTDFELGKWLGELASVPVFVDNDANVAALGEARHGAGAGNEPGFLRHARQRCGRRIDCGRHRIYHGATPGEAEIGPYSAAPCWNHPRIPLFRPSAWTPEFAR